MNEDALIKRFCRMFKCDAARISRYHGNKMFLILGWNRNTKKQHEKGKSSGQWMRSEGGELVPFDFDYLEEKVIASGKTLKALTASALKRTTKKKTGDAL